ncbi:uncharacterized protein LOC130452890 isoform X2 [Diorhabda sublineata]|uniref:uncharacterized protein LOC130452890 isoform X2 n=1 Tax=Diorhabda sublineata TaxID=1163346 RepID=UPI0024E15FC7|nr:uncharacterized protein LOC130452890 isoform X2 [Diorhabda sublineata]
MSIMVRHFVSFGKQKRSNNQYKTSPDGSPWIPKPTDTICSDHFVGGRKAEEETSPSYIPTIFPLVYKKSIIDEKKSISRHKRFLNRRLAKNQIAAVTTDAEVIPLSTDIIVNSINGVLIDQCKQTDKCCQVDFLPNSDPAGKTFICNKYMYVSCNRSDAEIQTEIIEAKGKIIINPKKCTDKECNTPIRYSTTQSS